MTTKTAEQYVIGEPSVVIPARVCVALTKRLRLDEVRLIERGKDADVDAVLLAISAIERGWRAFRVPISTPGSEPTPHREAATPWDHLSSHQVAERLGITKRRVNDMCNDGTLPARKLDGRWLISSEEFHSFISART